MPEDILARFEKLIRRDPAHRGLIGTEPQFGPLCPGHLTAAAKHVAQFGRSVAIVTGFFIPRGEPPAAETDGPPGALLLADALRLAGLETCVITDEYCLPAVRAAASAQGFPAEQVLVNLAIKERGRLSHLIAIERVGPSHTVASLRKQSRTGAPPDAEFAAGVPLDHADRCHNMRGEVIDEYAGDLHRVFEGFTVDRRPAQRSIGIGDGGNEIGMGCIPWEDLRRRLPGEHAAWIPCRVATDWNIIAGTSNWGAYALAAGVLSLLGKADLLRPFDAAQQRQVLEAMVAHGPAVDGVTRRREPTVDGLAFETYIAPWVEIRRALGLE